SRRRDWLARRKSSAMLDSVLCKALEQLKARFNSFGTTPGNSALRCGLFQFADGDADWIEEAARRTMKIRDPRLRLACHRTRDEYGYGRMLLLDGPVTARADFVAVAKCAGELLRRIIKSNSTVAQSDATRYETDPFYLWIWALFDIAWSNASPLFSAERRI